MTLRSGFLTLILAVPLLSQFPPSPVVVSPVVERTIETKIKLVGTIRPIREVTLGSEVEGRLEEIRAEEGQRIERGQVLARLRRRPVEIAVSAARAGLALRQEELAELKAGSRPEEIAMARARLDSAVADVELARWQLERAEQLKRGDTVSEDEVKTARRELARAEAIQAEARASLTLAEIGPRTEQIVQAEARLAQQGEEVHRLEDELMRHDVTASFDGYIAARHVEAGAWVSKGTAVYSVIALDSVDIEVPFPEDYVGALHHGDPVEVLLTASGGLSLEGRIEAIVPLADFRSRTFPVKVRVENALVDEKPRLLAGMFAELIFTLPGTKSSMLVPKDALVLGGAQPLVYVVSAPEGAYGTVRAVPVEAGSSVGGNIAVKGKLAGGDLVVVRGNERLRPGQQIQIASRIEPDGSSDNGTR